MPKRVRHDSAKGFIEPNRKRKVAKIMINRSVMLNSFQHLITDLKKGLCSSP